MKLISFSTSTFESDVDKDLTIFFELTDKDYKTLRKMDFFDIYDMYTHCLNISVGCWNNLIFSNDDEIGLDGSVFNHTDHEFITPEF
jgi:hypothetical protein